MFGEYWSESSLYKKLSKNSKINNNNKKIIETKKLPNTFVVEK